MNRMIMKKTISCIALMLPLLFVKGNAQVSQDLIYIGSWQSEGSTIQNILSDKGYFNHETTGYYGPITQKAVINFQKDSNINADGIVGPITRSKLYSSHTNEDIYWLSMIVHAEAQGESYEGKVAVANCILNRVKSKDFPNTIYSVIFDRKYGVQYEPTINGTIYNNPNTQSVEASKAALSGYNNIGKSMYFYNPKKSSNNWISKNRKYYATIGNHNFHL